MNFATFSVIAASLVCIYPDKEHTPPNAGVGNLYCHTIGDTGSLPASVKPQVPALSTFFSTVFIEQTGYDTPSNGDLWATAWSDDGYLYSANGDGKGFDLQSSWADIVSNRIDGHPKDRNVSGIRLSGGDEVGSVWGDTSEYNRKPTGMVSVDGVLYLAVQDLNKKDPNKFNDAPSASVIKSVDKGRTWTWNKRSPMFTDHTFTTIMFLDYGKDSRDNIFDDYVYAYGLDFNWRDSYSDYVPDPDKLYLARIPKDALQDAGRWQFYTGDLEGHASWSAPGDTAARKPVLQDDRRRHQHIYDSGTGPRNTSVVSQGSVVYNKALKRYIYASWSSLTHEFYEAPNPWGPWRLFLSRDYGGYPWNEKSYGGYAPVIPSKYISEDGTEMWVSTSTFSGGVRHYDFSLRRLWVSPYKPSSPGNTFSDKNLALSADPRKVSPISAGNVRNGTLFALNDGITDADSSINSFSREIKQIDYWGFTWPTALHFNKLVYKAGQIRPGEGGWFTGLKVEVRRNFTWTAVKNLRIDPAYSYDEHIKPGASYTLTFDDTWGDGIRIIGPAGGKYTYTSASELEVYYSKN